MTTQIQEYSKTEAALADLRTQLADVVFDCTTPAGLKEAKDSKMLLVKVRTGLEKIRVEIKGPALERCNLIDSEARRIRGEVEELEQPILEQIQKEAERQAEIERKAAEAEREAKEKWLRKILAIKSRPLDFIGADPDVVLAALEKARGAAKVIPGKFPEEHREECDSAFTSAIKQMEQMHIDALNRADLEKRAESAPELNEPESDTPSGEVSPPSPELAPPAHSSIQVKPAPESAESVIDDICNDDVAPFEPDPEPTPTSELIEAAKAVVAHYGNFRKPHASIIALEAAINAVESV